MKWLANALSLTVLSVVAVGCSTTTRNLGDGSGDPNKLVVTDRIGPADLQAIATAIADDIKNSPAVHASPNAPALVRVQPFIDESDDTRFPMAELIDTVNNELTRTGKLNAISNDPAALEGWIVKQKLSHRSGIHLEDYTLTGRVTRDEETAGNVKQITYYVNFKLHDTNSGAVVLTSQTKRIKQKEKSFLGL